MSLQEVIAAAHKMAEYESNIASEHYKYCSSTICTKQVHLAIADSWTMFAASLTGE